MSESCDLGQKSASPSGTIRLLRIFFGHGTSPVTVKANCGEIFYAAPVCDGLCIAGKDGRVVRNAKDSPGGGSRH